MSAYRTLWLPWVPLVLALLLAGPAAIGQDDRETEAGAAAEMGRIHDDLTELRFEKALAGVEALLSRPSLSEPDRVQALVLRSEAHVALGDLGAAERDYEAILLLRPAYVPEASLTPRKAMQRFDKVRAALVGTLTLVLDPPDAELFVNGRAVTVDPAGQVHVLAGEHELRAEASGFDALEQTAVVEAGGETTLSLRLTPNARTVIVQTEPSGVEVWLDGVEVGRTRRGESRGVGQLVLPHLPLGEHVFELRRECYRTAVVDEILTVDLLDRTPRRLNPVRLIQARSTLIFEGGPDGGEVRVDGERVGHLPLERCEICPGRREIEVRFRGRVIWREQAEIRESSELRMAIEPRPNVAMIGTEEWPLALRTAGAGFNTLMADFPRGSRGDLTDPEAWRGARLPENTDLALVLVPARGEGGRDSWVLYSPILDTAQPLDLARANWERPTWESVSWGFSAVDSQLVGSPVVIEVRAGGPAEEAGLAVGDRIIRAGGTDVTRTSELDRQLDAAQSAERVELKWLSASGEPRGATLSGAPGPDLLAMQPSPVRAAVLAAWAQAQAEGTGDQAPTALANLALLLAAHGQNRAAADAWRRVHWPERSGVGEGTKLYYLGRELERLGDEASAVEALGGAAASEATAFGDAGPRVAPAARDRLADLGVISR